MIPIIGKTKLTQEQLQQMAPTKPTFCPECGTKTTPHFTENEYHEQAWRLYCLECKAEVCPQGDAGTRMTVYLVIRKK